MSEINDLDILRPKANIIKIGGEEVDISFVPNGITFEVDRLLREINKVATSMEDLAGDEYKQEKAFELSIDLCVLFCSRKHPKLNKQFFMDDAIPIQIRAIVDGIKLALNDSYAAVAKYGKN